REAAAERFLDEPDKQANDDDHVQGVQSGHGEVQRKIELSLGIGVQVGSEGLLHLFLFGGNFSRVIRGRGMRRPIGHIKTVAGNEMVVEFLLVFNDFDAKKDCAETQRGNQKSSDELFLACLYGTIGHGNGQAAQNEHNRVEL